MRRLLSLCAILAAANLGCSVLVGSSLDKKEKEAIGGGGGDSGTGSSIDDMKLGFSVAPQAFYSDDDLSLQVTLSGWDGFYFGDAAMRATDTRAGYYTVSYERIDATEELIVTEAHDSPLTIPAAKLISPGHTSIKLVVRAFDNQKNPIGNLTASAETHHCVGDDTYEGCHGGGGSRVPASEINFAMSVDPNQYDANTNELAVAIDLGGTNGFYLDDPERSGEVNVGYYELLLRGGGDEYHIVRDWALQTRVSVSAFDVISMPDHTLVAKLYYGDGQPAGIEQSVDLRRCQLGTTGQGNHCPGQFGHGGGGNGGGAPAACYPQDSNGTTCDPWEGTGVSSPPGCDRDHDPNSGYAITFKEINPHGSVSKDNGELFWEAEYWGPAGAIRFEARIDGIAGGVSIPEATRYRALVASDVFRSKLSIDLQDYPSIETGAQWLRLDIFTDTSGPPTHSRCWPIHVVH